MERVEEYARVIDYLPEGKVSQGPPFRKEPLAQVVGETYFTLLEVVPKRELKADETGRERQVYKTLTQGERVYIGRGERDKIHFIKQRIKYAELTNFASTELEHVVRELVKAQEKRFLEFFNKAESLTTRQHQLELLPKIGKKLMWEILEERKKAPFQSFEELRTRVKNLPNPESIIVDRLLSEVKGESKYYLFTAHPPEEERQF